MHTENNTILVTGGAARIGFALAKQLLVENNNVIICGRREEALQAAKQKLPKLQIRVADLNNAEERNNLVAWTTENFPNLTFWLTMPGFSVSFE